MTLKAKVLQAPIPEPLAPSPEPEASNDKTPKNIEKRKGVRRKQNRRKVKTKWVSNVNFATLTSREQINGSYR